MDNVTTTRIINLQALVDKAGTKAQFARNHQGVDATYISQLLNKHRNFGEKAARNMENLIGLPSGWFDVNHSDPVVMDTKVCPFAEITSAEYDLLTDADKKEVEGIIKLKLQKYQVQKCSHTTL